MFNIITVEDKVYCVGDELHFVLPNNSQFKGIYERINEFGQVYFSNLKVKSGRKWVDLEGSLKVSVCDIKEYGKKGNHKVLALIESVEPNNELVSTKGDIDFNIGDCIVVEVLGVDKRTEYQGIYKGLDGESVLLKICVVSEYLDILGGECSKYNMEEIRIPVKDINYVWRYYNKKHKYKVKISRKAN